MDRFSPEQRDCYSEHEIGQFLSMKLTHLTQIASPKSSWENHHYCVNFWPYQNEELLRLKWPTEILFILVKYFYNVKNGSSIITSKSSSKNFSNENKQWCFCCLQGKTWIRVPILWKHFSITEILWQTFRHNIWRSIFDVVEKCLSLLGSVS